ncbi:MAG TPA: hypothetical protein PK580_04255, partial [Nitrosomonas halophila]|nr:hypothetical protein [Nitrosomonas halophila]
YLLADENGNSTQVAKYSGTVRVNLIESKEYSYCCLSRDINSAVCELHLANTCRWEVASSK